MTRYLVRRLLATLTVLWLVATFSFALLTFLPGDAALASMPRGAVRDEALYQEYRRQLGLDQPASVRYLTWLTRAVHGDLGLSFRDHQPVVEGIAERLIPTAELSLLALLASIVVGLPMAVLSAIRPNSRADVAATVAALAGTTMPNFWLALLLILVFAVILGWLPAGGYVPFLESPLQNLRLMVLPVVTLGTAMVAITMRQARSALIGVLREEYVRTARAKGLQSRVIIVRHALPNALIPVVTIIGLNLGRLFGGAVVVESIFGIPGVGRLAMDSVFARDLPMLQGVLLVMAGAVIVSSLATDLAYAYLDPRIRYR